MDFLILLAPAVVLAVFLVTARLIRRPTPFSAKADFVPSNRVAPRVIANSTIVYGAGVATLAPLFAWGADGRFLTALGYAAAVGCGLVIVYLLRRPIVEYLADALEHDRSATLHAFVSRRHGDDPRVRAVAAALTVAALAGFVVCEMLALSTVLGPILSDSRAATELVLAVMLVVVTSCVIFSGHEGIMHAAGQQLGLAYVGMFGSTALLLYLQMSELGGVPRHGRLALALLAVVCAVMFARRRVRYVDTGAIVAQARATRPPPAARALSRFGKIVNVAVATCLGVVIGFCAVEFHVAGIAAVVHDGTALVANARLPGAAAIVLVLRALFHPLVDVVNWQRLAAFENLRDRGPDRHVNDRDPAWQRQWRREFRRFWTGYAVEATVMATVIFVFATLAGLGATPDPANIAGSLVAQLWAQDNFVATTVVSLLVLGLFAIAVSTIAALVGAVASTVVRDLVPVLAPRLLGPKLSLPEPAVTRVAAVAATGLSVGVFALFALADARDGMTLSSGGFLALVVGSSCLPLSFAPLLFGALTVRRAGSDGSAVARGVAPRWALAVMALGAVTGAGTAAAYLATGYEPWLWAAVPGCLAAGMLTYLVGWLLPLRRRSRHPAGDPVKPAFVTAGRPGSGRG